jgi:hypothetical protein
MPAHRPRAILSSEAGSTWTDPDLLALPCRVSFCRAKAGEQCKRQDGTPSPRIHPSRPVKGER